MEGRDYLTPSQMGSRATHWILRGPALLGLASALAHGCGAKEAPPATAPVSAALDRPNRPLKAATASEVDIFDEGDVIFEAIMRPADGLGPVFIKSACASCHREDGRGPGLVGKMGALAAAGHARDLATALPFGNTVRPAALGGATPVVAPAGVPGVRVTHRLPPAVFGRGYLEAIDDREIERLAERPPRDGIRGRIHRVPWGAEVNPDRRYHAYRKGTTDLIGRFGLKARIAAIDEFTADALQGDMGMTSPLRPRELPNPDGLLDDAKAGIDVTIERVNALADYTRILEIPERLAHTKEGSTLFQRVLCAACHVMSLKTRSDYPIAALAGIDAPVFTDLLLHDMGEALSDGVHDGDAKPREWRTAPLMGLRFFPAFMHDGRARDVEQAIEAHGAVDSEAYGSVQRFRQLNEEERATLLAFVRGL